MSEQFKNISTTNLNSIASFKSWILENVPSQKEEFLSNNILKIYVEYIENSIRNDKHATLTIWIPIINDLKKKLEIIESKGL